MLPFPPPPKEYQSLAEETKFEELKGLALDHKLEEAMIWAPTLPVRGGGGRPTLFILQQFSIPRRPLEGSEGK